MEEKDKQAFLEDFKKADVNKKLDMWYYAIDQEAFWEEIITEMSALASNNKPLQNTVNEE